MRQFECPACGSFLAFDNLACHCGTQVAWDQAMHGFVTRFTPCANRDLIACNWVAAEPGALCRSCAMTSVIPDTFHDENLGLWAEAERAKRWVLATLGRWGWFTPADAGPLPEFHLLSDHTSAGQVPVSMGHMAGIVTIDVSEADPATRVERRVALGERYRTMTGHFRHELSHFLFERLSVRQGFAEAFRALFGDERADYADALERYYRNGPPADWAQRHVSPYAASHPHEDWAESLSHVMHLADIADSAAAAGLSAPSLPGDYDAYAERDAARLVNIGVELGLALNHVNRAMGLPDIYPFVLTPEIRAKLEWGHGWLAGLRD